MEKLTQRDLLELREAISIALEQTNEEISIIPASEYYDEIFEFMILKAKNYINLLERIEEQLKQLQR